MTNPNDPEPTSNTASENEALLEMENIMLQDQVDALSHSNDLLLRQLKDKNEFIRLKHQEVRTLEQRIVEIERML